MVSGVALSLSVSVVTRGALHALLDSQVSEAGSVRLVILARLMASLPLMNSSPSGRLSVVILPLSRIICRLSSFHSPTTLWLLPPMESELGTV